MKRHYSHHTSNTSIDWWRVKLLRGGSHLRMGLQRWYCQVMWEWGKLLKDLLLTGILHLKNKKKFEFWLIKVTITKPSGPESSLPFEAMSCLTFWYLNAIRHFFPFNLVYITHRHIKCSTSTDTHTQTGEKVTPLHSHPVAVIWD